MQSLQVAMLGPRSVGKTSLLAAMYQEFHSSVAQAKLQLGVDAETASILQERLIDLKNLVRGGEGVPFTSGEVGVDALRRRSFLFKLGKPGAAPSLELRFKDFPGGFMSAKATEEQRGFVQHLVFQSAATVIPVDSPSLMECNGAWNELANRPMEVTEFLKTGYEGLNEPRLVILAPTKCEKYLREYEGGEKLAKRVKEEYAEMLQFLGSDGLREKVAVVIAPVQTVGDLQFNRVEVENRIPRFYFRPVPRAKYSPKDCEQPLRYLLAFLVNLHLSQRRWSYFNFLREIFGMDKHLQVAASEFARMMKTTGGFEILQGRGLLRIGD